MAGLPRIVVLVVVSDCHIHNRRAADKPDIAARRNLFDSSSRTNHS
jgi:hypothetical protein